MDRDKIREQIRSTRPVGENVLQNLESKVSAVAADLEKPPTRIDLALFSRSGFTPALQQLAAHREILLGTIEDVMAVTDRS